MVLNDVLALLDEAAQADVAYVIVPQATDSERHFCAGRLSAIQDLHSEFVELVKEAERGKKTMSPVNDVTRRQSESDKTAKHKRPNINPII